MTKGMIDGFERRIIRRAMATPVLGRDEEYDLAMRWRDLDDGDALQALTVAHMRMVVSAALKYRNYGLPLADLIQEGNVGLMMAASRFDPERGVRFSTYAMWWVRSQLQEYVLRNWSVVRTGTTTAQKKLFFSLRHLRARLGDGAAERLSPDSRNKIAERLSVRACDVEMMAARLFASDASLNATLGGGDGNVSDMNRTEWQDMIEDGGMSPDEVAMMSHDRDVRRKWLHDALATLNDRERAIVRARSLVDEDDRKTLETLGVEMGVSKERVRQIEARAHEKLRAKLTASADGDPHGAGLVP